MRPFHVKRVYLITATLWSAPAERSGDERSGDERSGDGPLVDSERPADSKAASRFACRRTPKLARK